MSAAPNDRTLNLALNTLERRETALLAWGIVDGGYTYDEVVETLDAHLGADRTAAEGLLKSLYERRLVMPFESSGGREVWRTRTAEAVRLIATLRQLFPYHLRKPGGWRHAPELVADYRFAVRPRRYPERRLDVAAVEQKLRETTALSALQAHALRALVGTYLLSDFQVASAQRLLADADGRKSRGLIVGAGTGTGKTLAFYLPALLKVVASAAADASEWVRVLGLYPRNELLKDQLTTALGSVLRLNSALRGQRSARPIALGAFYGDTPYGYKKNGELNHNGSWRETKEGWVCPYLREPRTDRALVWRREDVKEKRERLHLEGGGPLVADEHVIRLTRDALEKHPPHVLFASTEMLQRAMGTATNARLFGIRTTRPPELVLLDEAHTYGGTTGAQVAYLLRRYRHALSVLPQPTFHGALRHAGQRRPLLRRLGRVARACRDLHPGRRRRLSAGGGRPRVPLGVTGSPLQRRRPALDHDPNGGAPSPCARSP